MPEDHTEPLNEPPSNSAQFAAIFARLDRFESSLRADLERIESSLRADLERVESSLSRVESSLRNEMVERFIQVSRQVRNLDEKVDIFIREHLEIKQELREVRDSLTPKN